MPASAGKRQAAVDNLTHSIAGMLIAEATLQRADAGTRKLHRGMMYTTSIVANNLPDTDFVLSPLTEGKLGYLLHHRGHTHTVLVGLGLALVQWGICSAWLRRRNAQDWWPASRLVAFVSLVGVLLHLLLDFGNNYGVHPFWPFDSSWYYGDTVFIIEPWWWSIGGATFVRLVHSRAAKLVQLAIWGLGFIAPWLLPLPIESAVYGSVLALVALASAAVPLTGLKRLGGAACGLALLYVSQKFAHGSAMTQVLSVLRQDDWHYVVPARGQPRQAGIFDIAMTPLPTTPWCWDVLMVGRAPLERKPESTFKTPPAMAYVVRVGRATALPWVSPKRCPLMREAPTAPLESVVGATSERVVWDGEYRVPEEALLALSRSCWGAAFLRFARVPFVTGEQPVVGDLRYDRSPELEFSELELPPATAPCPQWVPPWVNARQYSTRGF